jgi:hypothetical protein
VRSFRGAESWWGGSLAWMAHSLSIYVTYFRTRYSFLRVELVVRT